MNVNFLLSVESILILDKVEDRKAAVDRILDAIFADSKCMDVLPTGICTDNVRAAIMEREESQPTGMGHGMAFPHARISGIKKPIIGMAIVHKPVDFYAVDGTAANIVVLSLVPEENPILSLKIMAYLTGLFSDEEYRSNIMNSSSPLDILDILQKEKLDVHALITAGDIMRPLLFTVKEDTPLRLVTSMMCNHRTNATVVVSRANEPLGEITCDALFKFGLPAFFTQLHSVAFIKEYDPFEKYFAKEAKLKAQDVMSTNFAVAPIGTTLMELVFALTTKGYPKVYVTEGGKVAGEVSQNTVLDRIINV